ncbi:Cytosolic purine 5'-nucleotidase, partial [Balamuthia mandrillaris]
MESEQQQTGDQEISPRKLMDERLRQSDGGSTGVPPTHLEDRLTLDHLSLPPTDEELEKLVHLPPSQLPKQFFRDSCKRVFVNRSLRLDRIEWVGFDMDYTLAVYKSPEFEALTYDIAIAHMIDMGYPQSISQLKYNPAYPIRGLFIDSQLGNMLKVDNFGHIIVCYHGRNRTKKKRVYEIYPSGKVRNEEIGGRYYPVSTLFALPEACLYADLVDHLEALQTTRRQRRNSFLEQQGDASSLDFDDDELIHAEDMDLSFTNLFQDVRATIDYIHNKGELKAAVVADLPRFVHRDPRIATLLHRLRASGKKIFLLTN